MKTSVLITLDPEAKETLKKRAEANGLSLSSYINMLGHASEVYHRIKVKEEEKNEAK